MQPFFFICHSAALCAYEFGTADDTAEFLKFLGYILLLPFAKRFCFLCHFVLPCVYFAVIRISIDIKTPIYLFKLITKRRPVNLTLVIIFEGKKINRLPFSVRIFY